MKKLVVLLFLITVTFLLLPNKVSATGLYVDYSYYRHDGVFLGYVSVDADDHAYGNTAPGVLGQAYVYQRSGYVFRGWKDTYGNLYVDEYDAIQGDFTEFTAYFELSSTNEDPILPEGTISNFTYGTTSFGSNIQFKFIYFLYTLDKEYTQEDFLINFTSNAYTDVTGFYLAHPDMITYGTYTMGIMNYPSTEENNQRFLYFPRITTSSTYTVYVGIRLLSSSAVDDTTASTYAAAFMDDIVIYNMNTEEYIDVYVNEALVETQGVYDSGYYAGYWNAYKTLEDQITIAVNEAESDLYYDLYTTGFGTDNTTSSSYVTGYSAGLVAAENDAISIIDFIPGILGVVVGFVLQIASIEFMGVSLLDLLVAIVSIMGAIIIVKIFISK